MQEYDYIVAGGGSAGCVLASRLSEDPGTRVLLIESGQRDSDKYIHIPATFFKVLEKGRDALFYASEAGEGPEWSSLDRAAGTCAWRRQFSQRDGLHPRLAPGLRHLGADGLSKLGL